jgi:putative redox protein
MIPFLVFLLDSSSISFLSLHIKYFSMETSRVTYTGDLRTEAKHVKSGQTFITDAPTDNQGKGEAFSPTDLLATSLGVCAITVVGIASRTHGFNVDGTAIKITKIMASDPRRVSEVIVEMDFPAVKYSEKEKSIIRHTIYTCPVGQSLHPDLKQTFILNFSD